MPLFLPSLVLMVVFMLSQCRSWTAIPLQHTCIYFCWFGHKSLLQLSAALWPGVGSEQELRHFRSGMGNPEVRCLSFHSTSGRQSDTWPLNYTEEVGVPHSEQAHHYIDACSKAAPQGSVLGQVARVD